MKNIELKIKVDSHDYFISTLSDIGVKQMGILHQVDSYFSVDKGRLKLREINGKDFELIYYERPDESKSKVSAYEIIKLTSGVAQQIKRILGDAMGIKAVVEKERGLWIYKNTRIHLDTVKRLGSYVELETVVSGISDEDAQNEHLQVAEMLNASKFEACDNSYSDILLLL